MRSLILCEGIGDLRFIQVYLEKAHGWEPDPDPSDLWGDQPRSAASAPQGHRFVYLVRREDAVMLWSVNGKDGFRSVIRDVVEQFVPSSAGLDSLVLVQDRDEDDLEEIRGRLEGCFPDPISLSDGSAVRYRTTAPDGLEVSTRVTLVVIPFDRQGAVETALLEALRKRGPDGRKIVQASEQFVDGLKDDPDIRAAGHLRRAPGRDARPRLVLKARFGAALSITHPLRSLEDVLAVVGSERWWERSAYIEEHFSRIARAVQDPEEKGTTI